MEAFFVILNAGAAMEVALFQKKTVRFLNDGALSVTAGTKAVGVETTAVRARYMGCVGGNLSMGGFFVLLMVGAAMEVQYLFL